MAWRKWVKTAFLINRELYKIFDHGFVQWLNGDRTANGIFNVVFRNAVMPSS
jgi:hypothetical protein